MRLLMLSWLASVAGCAGVSQNVARNGIPPIATYDGKLDPNAVYACTIENGQFACIPFETLEAERQREREQVTPPVRL